MTQAAAEVRLLTVIGIDAGFANLSMCVLRGYHGMPGVPHVMSWTNERISKGGSEDAVFWATLSWMDKNEETLANADYIVLERQMRSPFKEMNVMIRTRYSHKVTLVYPRTLSSKYGFSMKRAEKKRDTIKWALNNIGAIEGAKRDDLADSALLAHYGLNYIKVPLG